MIGSQAQRAIRRGRRVLAVGAAAVALAAGPGLGTAVGQTRAPVYVALGDSYSAGEGVGPYEPGTDEVTNKCHRGDGAFPKLVAAGPAGSRLPLQFVACGGARARHVYEEEQYSGDRPGGQVSVLRALGDSQPDDVVTVTIGGNDARFGEIVRTCIIALVPCWLAYADEEAWIEQQVRPVLAETFGAIREAAPEARIFALTYPQIFQAEDECFRDFGISKREKAWIRERWAQMNTVIVEEATAAGLLPLDVGDAFAGHEICTADPWVFGFLEGDGAFHPDADGHIALAGRMATALGGS